jgi:hypothetical protein
MILPSSLLAPISLAALAAPDMFSGDANGDSGTRTIVGALVILVILGVVVGIGQMMTGKRA